MAAGVSVFQQVGFRKLGDDLVGDEGDVTNTELRVSSKEHTLTLSFPKVDNFQLELSEDVFETYKAGPLSVLVKYPLGNLLVRLASVEDSSRLWSLIEKVSPHKRKENAFDRRTTDSSAQQYFQFYGYLSQQQNMLQDHVRTTTYQSAFFQNYVDFAGKVVLDVGAGTGILSFFAAQAGAAKVYAVEASNMAMHCKKLVETNKMESIISVIEGKIEEIDVPEMVDCIISEPMGYLLFNERMLESFIHARKWLKPGGKMFPSQGDLYISPFMDDALFLEQNGKSHFWFQQSFHGVDLSCLRGQAFDEYFHQPVVDTFDLRVLMAKPVRYMVNFLTTKESDLENIVIPLQYQVSTVGAIHGLAFWFDVAFIGTLFTVWLSTAPTQPLTHWYQVRCLLRQPLRITPGAIIMGTVILKANERQSYDIDLQLTNTQTGQTSSNSVDLKNPYFRYTGVAPQPPPGSDIESPTQKLLAQQTQLQGDREQAAYQSFPVSAAAAAHVSEEAALLSTASGYAGTSVPLPTPSAIPVPMPGGVAEQQASVVNVPMAMQEQGPANQFAPSQHVPQSK